MADETTQPTQTTGDEPDNSSKTPLKPIWAALLGIYLLLILWSTCPLWSAIDSMEDFQQSREGVKLT